VARIVVVLVLGRVFVVGGEVVAATTRVLAGRGRDVLFVVVLLQGPDFGSFYRAIRNEDETKTNRRSLAKQA
jgi:hypothetical protein